MIAIITYTTLGKRVRVPIETREQFEEQMVWVRKGVAEGFFRNVHVYECVEMEGAVA